MIKANIHEIKAQLSKYIEAVASGETVLVCKRNVPIAEIRPLQTEQKRVPALGSAAGRGRMLPSFLEPMSEQELLAWVRGLPSDPVEEYAPSKAPRE